MPADAGDIDHIHFFSVRLPGDFADPDPEPLDQLLFDHHIPEFLCVADPYRKHKILRKLFPVELL